MNLRLSDSFAFPNGMRPTDVKKMHNIKQIMKYADHDHQEF
jgi:hypothetical protein